MKILFIEDRPETIEPAEELIKKKFVQADTDICNFEDAGSRLRSFRPHLVILDLIKDEDAAGSEVEGLNTYQAIWDSHFCPVIVYSARKEEYENSREPHPLVISELKGAGSEIPVVKAIEKLTPYIEALKKSENLVRECLSSAMRDTALRASSTPMPADRLADIVTRSGRRRVAAMMDEPVPGESQLASWEIYLYPPVSNQKLLGDVLRKSDGDPGDPGSFRVVLTPSCDMVDAGSQKPRVDKVLVANCSPMNQVLQSMGMQNSAAVTLKKELPRKMLNQGYFQDFIPLPYLEGAIPAMAANLKDLALIPISDIGPEHEFTTIASVDSPFREQVAWAYLQITGRPGLPERDTSTWAEDIIKAVEK